MIITLIKRNKKTSDIVILEQEDNLIYVKEGKYGKPTSFSSTSNFGDSNNALIEIEKLKKEYESMGYSLFEDELVNFIVFDKAKWHFDGEFPKELNKYQAYVHTGFYIGWLIMKSLISDELGKSAVSEIIAFKNKQITAIQLYKAHLDGVFTSDDVNKMGYDFTKKYFDFETGKYLEDYEKTLAQDLPSLYYVEDTWENFDKISIVIEKHFAMFQN